MNLVSNGVLGFRLWCCFSCYCCCGLPSTSRCSKTALQTSPSLFCDFCYYGSEHFFILGCWPWAGTPSKKNYSIYSSGAVLEPCDFSRTHFKLSLGQEPRGCRDPPRQGLW